MNGGDFTDGLVGRNIDKYIVESDLISTGVVVLKDEVIVDTGNNLEINM